MTTHQDTPAPAGAEPVSSCQATGERPAIPQRPVLTRLNVHDARCEALFASGLQRSDAPTAEAVAEAISRALRQFGIRGCAGQMAQEFGDHPEAAADRMRWVRWLADQVFASPVPQQATQGWPAPARSPSPAARPATRSARRAA